MNNIYKRIEHQNNIFTYRIDDPWIEIHLFSSMVVKKFYRHISKFKNLLPEDNTNLYIKKERTHYGTSVFSIATPLFLVSYYM